MAIQHDQFMVAKQYIRLSEYDKARRILKGMQHPTADKWLRNLNRRHPPKNQWVTVIVVVILAVVVGLLIAWFLHVRHLAWLSDCLAIKLYSCS